MSIKPKLFNKFSFVLIECVISPSSFSLPLITFNPKIFSSEKLFNFSWQRAFVTIAGNCMSLHVFFHLQTLHVCHHLQCDSYSVRVVTRWWGRASTSLPSAPFISPHSQLCQPFLLKNPNFLFFTYHCLRKWVISILLYKSKYQQWSPHGWFLKS